MSFLYSFKRRLHRALPNPVRRRLQEAIYFLLYRLSPARHQNFFNSGFSPASEDLSAQPPFDREPLQATLYDQVLWTLTRGAERRDWEEVLDIGCGLGGGMQVAANRFPNARITGVDANGSAIRVCRRRLRAFPDLSVRQANARQLPFSDKSFDMIFSVGVASYVGTPAFMAEAARVLRPGGTLSFSVGHTNKTLPDQIRLINSLAAKNGLKVCKIVDITENVFDAIAADVPRRMALIERVPAPFRGYAMNWADMPGTQRYEEYVEGRRLDYAVVCERI